MDTQKNLISGITRSVTNDAVIFDDEPNVEVSKNAVMDDIDLFVDLDVEKDETLILVFGDEKCEHTSKQREPKPSDEEEMLNFLQVIFPKFSAEDFQKFAHENKIK